MASEKKRKIAKELEQIRRMQSIKDVIDRSNSENTLLYTSSRENDSVSDDVIDNLLSKMSEDRETERNIRMVEGMTKETGNGRSERSRSVRRGRRAPTRARRHARPMKRKPNAGAKSKSGRKQVRRKTAAKRSPARNRKAARSRRTGRRR